MNEEIIKQINKSELDPTSKALGVLGVMLDAEPDVIIHGMMSTQNAVTTEKLESESKKPRLPRGLNETEKVLFDMLWESTGSDMCDSGGAYGRSWQVNRGIKDFRDLPALTVQKDSYGNYLEISMNIFHYLNERVTYDPLMNREFVKFCKGKDDYDWSLMTDFAEKMHQEDQYDMMPKPIEGNSYNEENALSQTIQYALFNYGESVYALIQIHQGADVRGGYTEPRAFCLGDVDDAFRLFDWCKISGSCDCIDSDTDDLYHWYDSDPFFKEWNWSEKHHAFFCKECQSRVNFSN